MNPVKCADSIVRTEAVRQSLIEFLKGYDEPLEGCILLCLQPGWTFDMVQECVSDESASTILAAAAKVINGREARHDSE